MKMVIIHVAVIIAQVALILGFLASRGTPDAAIWTVGLLLAGLMFAIDTLKETK